jgi:hypothetical protein
MAVPARATDKTVFTGDSGELRAMHLHKPCGYSDCQEHGIASLGAEDLCCDHFVLRCYEFLQQIDVRTRDKKDVDGSPDQMGSVNSCLQGALEVSLRAASLSNLQKARLLDVILWAGEYVHRAEEHRFNSQAVRENSGQRATYQKPQIKTSTTLLPQ